MTVLLGTSGWSYDSWVGSFYPESYAEKKQRWLEHYARFFPTVELVSTAFKMPGTGIVDSWIKKTNDFEKFEFSLVIPHYISHHLLSTGNMEKTRKALDEFEENVMARLYMKDRLGMVLFELSYRYAYEEKNYRKLVKVMDLFKYLSYNYAIEFQNRSWLNADHDDLRDNILYHLRERNIALCVVDGENFPFIPDIHSENIYFKLYGRNKEAWEKVKQQSVSSSELFDYSYTESELNGIVKRIGPHEGKTVRIYFKNHEGGQAPRDARRLAAIMGLSDYDGKQRPGTGPEEARPYWKRNHDGQTRFDDFAP